MTQPQAHPRALWPLATPAASDALGQPVDAGAPQRAQLALWASGISVWEWRAEGNQVQVERWVADAGPGVRGELLAQMTLAEFGERAHPEDRLAIAEAWRAHLRGQTTEVDLRLRVVDQDVPHWLRLRGRAVDRDAAGRVSRVVGTLKDITAQAEAEAALRLMAHAFASTREALVLVDERWGVLQHNEAAAGLLADAALQPGADLRQWTGADNGLLEQLQAQGRWQGERALQVGSAEAAGVVPVEMVVSAVRAAPGQPPCFLVALHDLRERRQAEARLAQLATVDKLTGLPNRLAAQWHAEQLLARPDTCFGLLFIDLDGFKALNESYGPEQGDRLLQGVGERLRQSLARDAYLARWGSDEFLVVLPPGSGDTEVRAAAQGVLAALALPFEVGEHALSVTPTLGAVLAPQDGNEFNALVRKADLAVNAGKDRGRNALVFYDDSLDTDAQRRVRMISLLRADTDRNGFRFVAQPKVDAQGVPVGAELLMRWNTEAFGNVSPVEFIPLAEKVGLIQLMGRHAAHAAAQLAAACVEIGAHLPVAVNLSPRQLLQPGLDGVMLQACKRHGITPDMLELELTESALVHNMDVVAPMLNRLRNHGFSLALDDFGTGYSSLSYLRHLPFDKVKIDRSFVLDIDRDPAASRMLESIVQLCTALGKKIVAEGVETPQQLAALTALGVQEFQGYHFARPMPVDSWLQLLREAQGQPIHLPMLPGQHPQPAAPPG